jgi:hypothetical protein
MRLTLLMGRRYAPYSKWLGTVFAGLPNPDGLGSSLAEAAAAGMLMAREEALGRAARPNIQLIDRISCTRSHAPILNGTG